MSENYYDRLKEIRFFERHPSYIPFVGNEYEKYRILQISESHYNKATVAAGKYGIAYFSKWFDEECPEVETALLNNNLTRGVCEKVCAGTRYSNFDDPLRSFMGIVLGIENPRVRKYNRELYHHFAFMNFYQMPAFEEKGYFKQAIYRQGKRENLSEQAQALLETCRETSTQVVDKVISVLDPKAIAFTSIDAWEQYVAYGGRYVEDERMIFTAHPGRPWHSPQNKLQGHTGKEVFETRLQDIYL